MTNHSGNAGKWCQDKAEWHCVTCMQKKNDNFMLLKPEKQFKHC